MKIFYILPLFLGACSIIPSPGEAPTRYFLEKITFAEKEENDKKQISSKKIAIDMPVIYTPLDVNRIAVIPEKNQLDYYAGMEWADRLSTLVRESLIHSLQDSHFFASVSRLTDGITPDQILKIDIRKFYILRTKEDKKNIELKTACVEFYISLVDVTTRHILRDKTFEAQIPIKIENKEEISEGLNEANKHVLIDIINWLKEII